MIYVSEHFLQKRYPTNGQVEHASNVRIAITDKDLIDNRLAKIKEQEEIAEYLDNKNQWM